MKEINLSGFDIIENLPCEQMENVKEAILAALWSLRKIRPIAWEINLSVKVYSEESEEVK